MRTLLIIIFLAFNCTAAFAQVGQLFVSGDSQGISGEIHAGGTFFLYFFYVSGLPATSVRLSAPFPACMNNTVCLLAYSQFATVGDPQDGITINFEQCLNPAVLLFWMMVNVTEPIDDCCLYYPIAHPDASSGKAEVVTCTGDTMLVGGHAIVINPTEDCFWTLYMIMPEVSNPTPSDSAQNVQLNTKLSWDIFDPEKGVSQYFMRFGTSTNPPIVANLFTGNSYDPGVLLPSTTYYWKVGVWVDYPGQYRLGPLWSFSTTADSEVEKQTWGTIKALYN